MKIIKQSYQINATAQKVWQALTNPKIIDKWGGGKAKMNEKVGTKFKLWSGEIYGTNKKVTKNKELIQDWFGGEWDQPSIVTFTLHTSGSKTILNLVHTNIPDSEADDIEDGWKRYYLGPLKKLLES